MSVGKLVWLNFNGVRMWSRTNSGSVCPLTFSTVMPSRIVLVLQYSKPLPGSKSLGSAKAKSSSSRGVKGRFGLPYSAFWKSAVAL